MELQPLDVAEECIDVDMIQRHFHDGPFANRVFWVPCVDRLRLWSFEDNGPVHYEYKCGIDKMVLVKEKDDGSK